MIRAGILQEIHERYIIYQLLVRDPSQGALLLALPFDVISNTVDSTRWAQRSQVHALGPALAPRYKAFELAAQFRVPGEDSRF